MRALVADDDTASRLLLQKMLTKWGYEVVTASSGEEAWKILTSDDAPGLAVLDWMMPELDGVEVCRRIRALELSSPPYLLLLTGRDNKQDIATGLESGASDYLQKPVDRDELRARLLVGKRFAELNRKLLDTQAELRRQALTDPLTRIMNRRAIFARLNEEIARAPRQGLPLSIGVLDIDHFKSINDRFGHAGGDAVLQEIVVRGQNTLRTYDAIGRIGGEEFLMVMSGVGPRDTEIVLERLRRAVADVPFIAQGQQVMVTVSIGGALCQGQTMDELLALADDALYMAKNQGRNRVVLADSAQVAKDRADASVVSAIQPPTQPLTQPVIQPVTQPTIQPATQPLTQPVVQPTTQSVTEIAAEPPTQPLT